MSEIVLNVEGMMCEGCEGSITNVVKKIPKVVNVTANHAEKKVTCTGDGFDINLIKEAITKAGFDIKE
eukprot:CAMPEP_0119306644 /NCGR_PEP_ID=MMETSP1333-20130426/7348_1 /TAXON_ID=418940 /ORGANISM="Scyphosphaera apsteinii, Strain RCC1455" /LENGTH=67 /DNA_ID=CAMNT_0007309997 /DNA_START=94 /DNA_END=297 /DNA_ORIENTATION=+